MLVMNHGDVMLTDHSELARRLHVADADVRTVDWVDGECYVTLTDGTTRLVREAGFETVTSVPSPACLVIPDGSVQVVINWVGSDADRARLVLDDERARARPRKGLLAYLERLTV